MAKWNELLFKTPDPDPAVDAPPAPSAIMERLRAAQTPVSSPASDSYRGTAPSLAPDPQFTTDILDDLDKSTLPGYREFNAQMELLADAIPDEGMRITTALKSTAKFLNLTPAQIAAAVKEKLDILHRTKADFDAGLQREAEQRTATCRNHLSDVQTKLAANAAERARLETDQSDTQRQLSGIQADTQAVTSRFASAFAPLYESLTSTLSRLGTRA